MKAASWYPVYRSHLENVSLENVNVNHVARVSYGVPDRTLACARWWHHTPESHPDDWVRLSVWTPVLKSNYVRPACDFGQELKPRSTCGDKMAALWSALDDLGVVYYPLGGTELGVVKGSTLLKVDGDIDLFVDMPEVKLHEALKGKISISLYKDFQVLPNYQFGVWNIGSGCWRVNFFFVDYQPYHSLLDLHRRALHSDTCRCMIDSVPLSCHREGLHRMPQFFGPSWRVPLGVKWLDNPGLVIHFRKKGWSGWATESIRELLAKLKSMQSKNGLIEEDGVRRQAPGVVFDDGEMDMVLAQLNVLLAGMTQD